MYHHSFKTMLLKLCLGISGINLNYVISFLLEFNNANLITIQEIVRKVVQFMLNKLTLSFSCFFNILFLFNKFVL